MRRSGMSLFLIDANQGHLASRIPLSHRVQSLYGSTISLPAIATPSGVKRVQNPNRAGMSGENLR